ncbi:hypothetical protein UPYG_G00323790 [Umbra pygmaea]|uniref:Ig-like domain-containing protein n=1 Tax=Umbra pygmaea TaxID=75934 RepID=A0ABD0W1W5_UMBPY
MLESTEFLMALLISVLHFTGVSGGYLNVFYSAGDDVSLPCANVVHPDCSSTVWLYNRAGSQAPVEKVVMGQIQNEGESPERLNLGTYCSLDICNISIEDTGVYVCQQYIDKGRKKVEKDSVIQLSVLTMSVSTPEETFNDSLTVTLTCSLLTYGGPDTCDYFLQDGISLSWVNETGAVLLEDSSYKLTMTSGCNISLVVPLQTMENDRKWLCQLSEKTRKSFVYLISVWSGETADSVSFTAPKRQNWCQRPVEPDVNDLPVSRIVLCVALPLMVIIVAVFITRRNRPQEQKNSGIEL